MAELEQSWQNSWTQWWSRGLTQGLRKGQRSKWPRRGRQTMRPQESRLSGRPQKSQQIRRLETHHREPEVWTVPQGYPMLQRIRVSMLQGKYQQMQLGALSWSSGYRWTEPLPPSITVTRGTDPFGTLEKTGLLGKLGETELGEPNTWSHGGWRN